jgi:hypothetical protein
MKKRHTLNQNTILSISAVFLFLTMKKYKCAVTTLLELLDRAVEFGSAGRWPPYINKGCRSSW